MSVVGPGALYFRLECLQLTTPYVYSLWNNSFLAVSFEVVRQVLPTLMHFCIPYTELSSTRLDIHLRSASCSQYRLTSLQVRRFRLSNLTFRPNVLIPAIFVYTFAYLSDRSKLRSPFILSGLFLCLIGYSINISRVNNGVKYFGTYFIVVGSYSAFPGLVAW